MLKKLMFAAYAAVMMSFTTLAGNATWQLASGQAFRGDGQVCLYQTYTDNDGADWYTVDLGDVVSAFANGTLDLSNPPRSTGYSGANGVKGPADVVDGVFAPQATTLGNMNDWYFSLVALVKVNGQDMLYVSGLNEEGGEGKYTTLLEFSLGDAEYDAVGGYKGKGYYRAPMPLQVNTTSLPNGTEMVAYDQSLSASGGTSPYTWDVVAQMMTRRANTWSEVASLGTQQEEWYADDNAWPLELPFAFPFYGETYTWIWISSNGNIFFSNDGTSNPRTSIVNEYARDESKFSNAKMLSVYWSDSQSSEDHPIYTLVESGRVVVRFDTSREGNNAKAAAELKPDGTIILRYSTEDSEGVNVSGAVGVSAGTGTDYVYRNYRSGELHETAVDDIVFETCAVGGLPPGMGLQIHTGALLGKPEVAGTYPLFVQVSDSASATAVKSLLLTIEENPNHKPVIESQTPAAEGASVAHGESIAFTVTANDPESDALSYSWKVNGVEKSTAGAAWTWTTGFYDGGDYTVTCDISDGVWTVTATWKVYVTRGLTWYVNGTGGDDANTGYESDHPLKTISKALEKAIDGETILVAEGTYVEGYEESDDHKYPKLRVTDGRRLTIRATGAREATIIDGGNETSCLWLNDKQTINTNVVVEGFTLQNGQASWLAGVGATGGGAFGGLLRNCTIQNCTAGSGNSGYGGGAAYARLENCTITRCKAHYEGGALKGCDAEGCVILGNSMGGTSSSARGCATYSGTLVNCLIADNEFESTVGGGMGAVYRSKLYGCTVTGNRNNASSDRYGAGVYGDANYTTLYNTIVYGNLSDGQPDEFQNVDGADLATCCTNDPSFVNAAAGDYRLLPTSICHNAGKNRYVIGTLDVAGEARIQEWTVDLGAYEYCPIMTITAAPTQATAGTDYSYSLKQTGGAEPVTWTIDAVPETKNVAGEVTDSSTFAVAGEKRFDGGGGTCKTIDLPFAFPYGGTTYTRAGICDYGAVTLGNDLWFQSYTGYSNKITDESILSMPVILPYLAFNWGTYGEDGCGIFVDQSVPQQVTIRWATYYKNEHYRANFSMTLYADGAIRFSYGDIDEGYGAPNVVGLSFGDGEHCLDMLSSFDGSNANDILFHPLAIPEGISVSGNQLVGMPTKGGTYRFRVTATEAGDEAQSKIVTMDVISNYTIQFDGNGNKSGTAPANEALTSVEEYVLPEPGMTCGCARFLGWATNATGAAVYQPGDRVKCLTTEPGATVTLYAAWENIFVLQFDGNASGVIGAHVAYTNEIGKSFTIWRDTGPQTNIVDFGNKYMPCRVGWYLDNWNMSADGSGEKFLRNATSSQWSQSVSSESFGANRGDVITLHAQWFESDWNFYWADPQLGGGKWIVRLKGDEGAKLWSVSGAVAWPESLTLPASYRERTVSSLETSLGSMNGAAYAIGQIIVPEGYTNLTDQAFINLYHLESITFPSTLEVIPKYCCEGCTNLTSVGFAEGNRVVGYEAFAWCTALSAVELSLGLTNLEANAFYNCTNLTAVVLSPDYVGGTSGSYQYQFYNCPIAKLEIPASCQGFGYQSLNRTKALRFLGDLPSWNVYNANHQFATLIEYPATNTTWNAGPIANYSTNPHKGFVGPVAAFGVTDAYFWTNANETVTFAYAESPLGATVTLPEGAISWGGVDWEIVGFEPDAFDGQPTATVYYPISEYAKWEQVTPPEGITLAPAPGTFFTLTFHVNGGDPFVPSQMSFPPNGTRELPSAVPTRSAYKFLGWATTADGAAAYQPGDNYTAGAVGGSATLFAKWEEVGNYTIRFNGNSANATGVPADIVTAVGTTPDIPADPIREGWTFSGWTNAVNATVYQSGDTFDEDCAKDSTFTLYAKWTEKSISNQSFVDGDGSTWTYNRTGDSITITAVSPGATVMSLTVPTAFKGGTVTNPTFDPKLVYSAGAWLKYSISSGEATITGFVGTLPADLVIPSSVTAGVSSCPVTKIGDYAFDATSSKPHRNTLESVVIPDSVKVIGSAAFRYCEGLETVSLGQGVERILHEAFVYDHNLAEIEFPSSLTNIGSYAFWNVRRGCAYAADGGLYADTGHTYLIAIDPALEGEVVVADTVKITGDGACMDLKATSVVFPSGLEIFGRNETFRSNLHTVAVTLPGSARLGEGSYTGYTSNIKTVTVMGAPPSWNLESYFTGLTTVVYDARYAAEWADYRAAHPEFEYVEETTEMPVGDYVKYDLEQDLGIVIGDYDKNEKVSVKGLPSGLKLVATKQTKKDKKKTVTNVVYRIEGVPTAACDFTQQPVYAVVTSGGKTTWQPIILSVAPQAVTDLDPLALGESVTTNACEWLPGVTNGWSVSGLPDGLKYTSKNVYAYKNAKKKTGKYLKYPAYTVYGKTTKAGLYTITAKKKKGSYYETLKYRVLVEPKAVDVSLFGESLTNLVTTAYEAYSNAVPVKVDKVTGLPAGLAFAAKNVYGYKDAKKKKGKYLKQAAQTIVGKPTKAGTYVVTYTKNVKSGKKTVAKTAQVVWTVLPSPVVPTADFNVSGGIVLNRNAGSSYATDSAAAMTFGVTPGASVSASGLPKGLSLKKVSDGTWAIVGTPSKTGTSYVTVTVKLNGNTVKQSVAIQVSAHPLAGNYSGEIWAADGSYLGTAQLTVSSVGKVSLSLVEKGVKTSATLSKVTAAEEDPLMPQAGKWKCVFSLKADKKKILPKRTLTLVFKRKLGEWELPTCYSESYTTSADAMFGDLELHRTLSKAEIAARVDAGRIPALPSVETVAILAGERGLSSDESVATGEVVVVSAVYKASAAAYTVTGRLPDGKTFSASSPVLWWGKADDSHDSLKMNTIAVSNGSGKQYLLGVYLPYGATSPESELQWCWYRQCWGDGQEWYADTFYGIFGGDWVALPGTVSAALGVEPGVALPLSLLWRAAALPGEAVEEGPYLFKVTEKTVTEKKKKVTKHYASVSADDGATWTTSKNPISWAAGRASFNVVLDGFDYAFDLALDKGGCFTGWARKSRTVTDKKGKKKTVVDAVGAATVSDTPS